MNLNNFYIGIVTKDRPEYLKKLLKSLNEYIDKVRIVDASDNCQYHLVKEYLYGAKGYYYNSLENYRSVNHNKNIIIHDFLKSPCEYLFIIEDDVKIIDDDIFHEYIKVSEEYNLPHLNAILPFQNNLVYTLDRKVDVCDMIYGFFQFFTRKCLETVTPHYRPELDKQCWEHVELTARIHKEFNYNPEFYHFPDIHNVYQYLVMMDAPTTTSVSKETIEQERQKMFNLLGWRSFPKESIKKLNINNIKQSV